MKRLALTICCLLACVVCYAKVVLVLRSWPRDPDLPQNLPDTSLPSNWDAVADHSPADNAALQALLDGDPEVTDVAAGEVIELDADVDYGTIVIDASVQGDADNWIIIRTDEYSSLPAYGSRVTAADETYMATISRAPTNELHHALQFSSGDGAAGASYIRLIGIKIEATGSGYAGTNYVGPVQWADYNNMDRTEHPEFIGLDRCVVTVGDDVNPWECQFNANDSFVVGCLWYNFWGGGQDGSNALRTYNGERLVVHNNKFECMSAGWFLGDGANPAPDDCRDLQFTNNYVTRQLAWDDESHGVSKSSFETKVAHRLLIANNVFDNQFEQSYNQSHAGISLKGEKNTTTNVTIRGNRIECYMAFVILAGASSGDDNESGPNTDILIEDNLAVCEQNAFRFFVGDDATGGPFLKRINISRNTFICAHASDLALDFRNHNSGTTPGQNLILLDNIIEGTLTAEGITQGAESLNDAWGSLYSVTYNILIGESASNYDDDAAPAPAGTLENNIFSAANVAAVGFTDSASGDYSLGGGSSYLTSSSTGGEPGYDSDTYDPIWAVVNP